MGVTTFSKGNAVASFNANGAAIAADLGGGAGNVVAGFDDDVAVAGKCTADIDAGYLSDACAV